MQNVLKKTPTLFEGHNYATREQRAYQGVATNYNDEYLLQILKEV